MPLPWEKGSLPVGCGEKEREPGLTGCFAAATGTTTRRTSARRIGTTTTRGTGTTTSGFGLFVLPLEPCGAYAAEQTAPLQRAYFY
jgi:hypothetical protein